jgi:hypothetical protein
LGSGVGQGGRGGRSMLMGDGEWESVDRIQRFRGLVLVVAAAAAAAAPAAAAVVLSVLSQAINPARNSVMPAVQEARIPFHHCLSPSS